MGRIEKWRKLSDAALWKRWRAGFDTPEEAIAEAIWTANRLVKESDPSTRRQFYRIKDEFIRRHQGVLSEGRHVRVETDPCFACEGEGVEPSLDDEPTEPCERCGGSGIYRQRTLYVHNFEIAGRRYSFHGYLEPRTLAAEPGEDLERYGGSFSEEELDEMPLPLQGLMRLLRHIAIKQWRLSLKDR